MRSTTSTYKQIIASGETREFHVRINMTLDDGTQLLLTDAEIMQGSFKYETASSGNSSFDIGSAIIGICSFSLKNFDDQYTRYDFFNAEASVFVKLEGDTEYIRLGFFTVDEPQYAGSIVQIEMLDNMWKFDLPVEGIGYPITCGSAVSTICSRCGVVLATPQFHGYDFLLTVEPDNNMNFRELLQYIAMITCNFCIIDDQGRLNLKWYSNSARPSDVLDGGSFDTNTTPYSDGDVVDGGNFTNYLSGDDYDGGTFTGDGNAVWFTRNFSATVGTDEINITGVSFALDDTEYHIGGSGYVLALENPLVNATNVTAVLNLIWEVLNGLKIRTFNISSLPDITAEVGDCIAIKTAKGHIVYSYITNSSFALTAQTVQCNAISPTRELTKRFSKTVQAAVEESKKKTQRAISAYDSGVQMMNSLAINAIGAYQDYEDLPTGGRVYYLSNKPITKVDNHCTFVAGSTVFKTTGDGFFVSLDGGQTFINGYSGGQLVVNVLKAIGVEADWVTTGTLTVGGVNNQNALIDVKDANGITCGTWTNEGIDVNKGKFGLLTIVAADGSIQAVGQKTFRVLTITKNTSKNKHRSYYFYPNTRYLVDDFELAFETPYNIDPTTSTHTQIGVVKVYQMQYVNDKWTRVYTYGSQAIYSDTVPTSINVDWHTKGYNDSDRIEVAIYNYDPEDITTRYGYGFKMRAIFKNTVTLYLSANKNVGDFQGNFTGSFEGSVGDWDWDDEKSQMQVYTNLFNNYYGTEGFSLGHGEDGGNNSVMKWLPEEGRAILRQDFADTDERGYIATDFIPPDNDSDDYKGEDGVDVGIKYSIHKPKGFYAYIQGVNDKAHLTNDEIKAYDASNYAKVTKSGVEVDNGSVNAQYGAAGITLTDGSTMGIASSTGVVYSYGNDTGSVQYNKINVVHANGANTKYIEVTCDDITRDNAGAVSVPQWISGSDQRIKENITDLDIDLSLNLIDATEPKRFKYKNKEGIHYGMIAQEARELLDNLGEGESELEYPLGVGDTMAINYAEYIPPMINYIKYLRAELNSVKNELRQLKEGK